jgi:hypothetical protein
MSHKSRRQIDASLVSASNPLRWILALIVLLSSAAVFAMLLTESDEASTPVADSKPESKPAANESIPPDPSKFAAAFAPTIVNDIAPTASTPQGMAWIPGGEFSMGSNVDSESLCSLPGVTRDAAPIHRVYVDGFWMDSTEVTNEQFAAFVERLVMSQLLKKNRQSTSSRGLLRRILSPVRLYLRRRQNQFRWTTTFNGGPTLPEPTGDIRPGRTAALLAVKSTLWFKLLTRTPRRTQNGQASDYRRRRNGNSLRVAELRDNFMPGEMNFSQVEYLLPISIRDSFQWRGETLRKMDLLASHQSPSFLRTITDSTTWQATCGNGRAIGIVLTTTKLWHLKAKSQEIHKVRTLH